MKLPAWLLWSLLAVLAWGHWAFLARVVSGRGWDLHPYANHLVGTVGLYAVVGASWLIRSQRPREVPAGGGALSGGLAGLAAGLLGSAGNILLYAAFARGGPAAIVSPLTGLYPLVTVLLALAILRERLGWTQVLGLPIALAAAFLLAIEPGASPQAALSLKLVDESWYQLSCGAIAAWGASGFLQKVATMHTSPHAANVAFAGGYLVTAAYCVATVDLQWTSLAAPAWLAGLAAGVLNGIGLVGVFAALGRGGKASVVTPLAGLYPVVTVALAVGCLGERPGPWGWVGVGLALGAGALLARE